MRLRPRRSLLLAADFGRDPGTDKLLSNTLHRKFRAGCGFAVRARRVRVAAVSRKRMLCGLAALRFRKGVHGWQADEFGAGELRKVKGTFGLLCLATLAKITVGR